MGRKLEQTALNTAASNAQQARLAYQRHAEKCKRPGCSQCAQMIETFLDWQDQAEAIGADLYASQYAQDQRNLSGQM